jgi:hypothetical protein
MKLQNNWRRLLRKAARLLSKPENWRKLEAVRSKIDNRAVRSVKDFNEVLANPNNYCFCMLGATMVCSAKPFPESEARKEIAYYSDGSSYGDMDKYVLPPKVKFKADKALLLSYKRRCGKDVIDVWKINDILIGNQEGVVQFMLDTANDPEINV